LCGLLSLAKRKGKIIFITVQFEKGEKGQISSSKKKQHGDLENGETQTFFSIRGVFSVLKRGGGGEEGGDRCVRSPTSFPSVISREERKGGGRSSVGERKKRKRQENTHSVGREKRANTASSRLGGES